VRHDPPSDEASREEEWDRGGHEADGVADLFASETRHQECPELPQPDGSRDDDADGERYPQTKIERARDGVDHEADILTALLRDDADRLGHRPDDPVGEEVRDDHPDHERREADDEALAQFGEMLPERHAPIAAQGVVRSERGVRPWPRLRSGWCPAKPVAGSAVGVGA
jgi:hypothetical protein